MKAARAQVEFFNSSTQALEKLYNIQKTTRQGEQSLKPLQDVKTRWWSTWRMLNRLLLLTPSIDALVASGQVNTSSLTASQKNVLTEVESLLSPIAKSQRTLEGDKYPTISLVPFFVWKVREKLKSKAMPTVDDEISPSTRFLATKMYNDYVQNRYGDGNTVYHDDYVLGRMQRYISMHKIVLVATFLDPRFKSLHPFVPDADKPRIYSHIVTLMYDIASTTCNIGDNNNPEPEAVNNEFDPDDFFAELGNLSVNPPVMPMDDTAMLCNAELNRYKLVPQISPTRDPLKWWADNALKFPVLATIALRYLAIPATSAASERLWSVASQIITKSRTQLDGHIVSDLMFLKENGHILQKHAQSIEGRERILPTVYEEKENASTAGVQQDENRVVAV